MIFFKSLIIFFSYYIFSSENISYGNLILSKNRTLNTPACGFNNCLLSSLGQAIRNERAERLFLCPLFEEPSIASILINLKAPTRILLADAQFVGPSSIHLKRKLAVLQHLFSCPHIQLYKTDLAMHQKTIILKGQRKIISGSMNITLSGTQQDEHLVVIDANQTDLSRALDYYEQFWQTGVPVSRLHGDWEKVCFPPINLLKKFSCPTVRGYPYFKANHYWPLFGVNEPSYPLFERIKELILSEVWQITILTYTLDHHGIIEALKQSLKTNPQLKIDILVGHRSAHELRKVLRSKRVDLFYCHDGRDSMHQKLAAFSSQNIVTAGSCNLSQKSARQFNDLVVINDPKAVELVERKKEFLRRNWTNIKL